MPYIRHTLSHLCLLLSTSGGTCRVVWGLRGEGRNQRQGNRLGSKCSNLGGDKNVAINQLPQSPVSPNHPLSKAIFLSSESQNQGQCLSPSSVDAAFTAALEMKTQQQWQFQKQTPFTGSAPFPVKERPALTKQKA